MACLLALAGTPVAACSLDAWDSVTASDAVGTSLVAGAPDDPAPVPRFNDGCALLSLAPGNYVSDQLPADVATYRARFFVFAEVGAGNADLFRATGASGETLIRVRYDGTAFDFQTSSVQAGRSSTALPGRWYGIEIDWYAGRPMTARVFGPGFVDDAPLITAGAGSDTELLRRVDLGWIDGAGSGRVVTDLFESRRVTGWDVQVFRRRCHGDTNGSESADGGDLVRIRNEILGLGLSPGQPDCTADGTVDDADLACNREGFLAGESSWGYCH